MSGTYYDILGVDPDASPEDIRKAYRKRALETHPDRLPQGSTPADKTAADEAFRQVNNAYQILTDDSKRRLYDLYGVWPPPEELPTGDSSQYRSPPQAPFRGGGTGHHDPFDHPFFKEPMFTHRHHRPSPMFTFRDPFELFNSFFPEFSMHRDPFQSHFSAGPSGFPGGSPTTMFPSTFGFQSSFPPFPAFLEDDLGQHFVFQSGSNSRQINTDQPPRWVSQSTSSYTVNGVRHITENKVDSHGNVHVRKVYPDGRTKYTINGVEQSRPPARIPNVPPPVGQLPSHRESDIHEIEPRRDSARPHRRSKSEKYYESGDSRHAYVPPPRDDSRPFVPPPADDSHHYPHHRQSRKDVRYEDPAKASGGNFPQDSTSKKSWWKRH